MSVFHAGKKRKNKMKKLWNLSILEECVESLLPPDRKTVLDRNCALKVNNIYKHEYLPPYLPFCDKRFIF